MNVTCNKCGTVSQIPDSIIPSGGINIECPNCSTPIFVNPIKNSSQLGFDSISLDDSPIEAPSFPDHSLSISDSIDVSLDSIDISIESPASENISLDVDYSANDSGEFNNLKQPEISPSMILDIPIQNSEGLKEPQKTVVSNKGVSQEDKIVAQKNDLQDKLAKKREEKKRIEDNNQEISQKKVKKSAIENYLNLQTAAKIESKKSNPVILILVVALLGIVGGGVYFLTAKKETKINSMVSLGIENIFSDLNQDNYYNYNFALKAVNDKLQQQPNEVLLKSAYVYVATKYFLSINTVVESFAPNYKSYYNDIVKHVQKDPFIKKTSLFYQLATIKNTIPASLQQDIFSIPTTDTDSLLLKGYLFFKQEKYEQLTTVLKQNSIPILSILLKTALIQKENISEIYSKIQALNPSHVLSRFLSISYYESFSMNDKIAEILSEIESLKKYMGDYEVALLYLEKSSQERRNLRIDEAYKFVRMAEDVRLDNYTILMRILKFYHENYYNSAALDLLKQYYKKYSYDFDVSKIYVDLLIRTEDYGQAGQICTTLRESFPKKAESHYISALLSYQLKNSVTTIEHSQKAIELDPKFEPAYVLLSQQYLENGKKNDAINILKDGIDKSEKATILKSGLADVFFDLERFDDAEKLYKEVVSEKESFDTNSEFKLALINYYKDKNLAPLLDKLKNLYNIDPNFGKIRITLAQYEMENGDFQKVIDLVNSELKIRPKSPDAYLYLGKAYMKLNKLDLALENFQKGISYSPKFADIHFNMGLIYKKQDRQQKALDSFILANSYSLTQKAEYLHEIGRTYDKLGKYSEALEYYNKLIELSASFDALFERGKIYEKSGLSDKAIEDFNSAYVLNSTHIELIALTGELYFKTNRYKDATIKFQRVVSLDKTNANAYFKIGRILELDGKTSKAIPYYEKAIKFDGKVAEYYSQLGYLYKELGKYKKALGVFRNYLKNIPDTPDRVEIENEIHDLKEL
ncbi:zinc-ribbon domain-containing protein [bacterium]|nr:zinc-ribbon domain-containing protein [bacterium]